MNTCCILGTLWGLRRSNKQEGCHPRSTQSEEVHTGRNLVSQLLLPPHSSLMVSKPSLRFYLLIPSKAPPWFQRGPCLEMCLLMVQVPFYLPRHWFQKQVSEQAPCQRKTCEAPWGSECTPEPLHGLPNSGALEAAPSSSNIVNGASACAEAQGQGPGLPWLPVSKTGLVQVETSWPP